MFKWVERNTLPDYTFEMLHCRNAMVIEINLAFSENYKSKKDKDDSIQEKFEEVKDFREKTANRVTKESQKFKIWYDLFYDVFRNSMDFTSADLFIKYFNIPNEAILPDFHYAMSQPDSTYRALIESQSFQTAFDFLSFFPESDSLLEYGLMVRKAVEKGNSEGVKFLAEQLRIVPFDSLINDNEIVDLFKKEYEKAEKEKRINDAKTLADTLKVGDLIKRVYALEAMMNNKLDDAVSHLKEIRNLGSFRQIVKEYYDKAMKVGADTGSIDMYKIAYAYAEYGNIDTENPKKFLKPPAGKLFKHYLLKEEANESDYYEAEKYFDNCDKETVQNTIAEKVLKLVMNNDSSKAKYFIKRFKVRFMPGEYSGENDIREYYKTLTETWGTLAVPKGEENLLTAWDIADIFHFSTTDIEELKQMICKFYITNAMPDKAKKYYVETKELRKIIVEKITSSISTKQYNTAYKMAESFPFKMTRETRSELVRELKEITQGKNTSMENLAKAIIIDDVFTLKKLPKSVYKETFDYGLDSGAKGVDLLVDLSYTFKKYINACGIIMLSKNVKKLIATDKLSAELLVKAYGRFTKPDVMDWIAYFFRKILGAC